MRYKLTQFISVIIIAVFALQPFDFAQGKSLAWGRTKGEGAPTGVGSDPAPLSPGLRLCPTTTHAWRISLRLKSLRPLAVEEKKPAKGKRGNSPLDGRKTEKLAPHARIFQFLCKGVSPGGKTVAHSLTGVGAKVWKGKSEAELQEYLTDLVVAGLVEIRVSGAGVLYAPAPGNKMLMTMFQEELAALGDDATLDDVREAVRRMAMELTRRPLRPSLYDELAGLLNLYGYADMWDNLPKLSRAAKKAVGYSETAKWRNQKLDWTKESFLIILCRTGPDEFRKILSVLYRKRDYKEFEFLIRACEKYGLFANLPAWLPEMARKVLEEKARIDEFIGRYGLPRYGRHYPEEADLMRLLRKDTCDPDNILRLIDRVGAGPERQESKEEKITDYDRATDRFMTLAGSSEYYAAALKEALERVSDNFVNAELIRKFYKDRIGGDIMSRLGIRLRTYLTPDQVGAALIPPSHYHPGQRSGKFQEFCDDFGDEEEEDEEISGSILRPLAAGQRRLTPDEMAIQRAREVEAQNADMVNMAKKKGETKSLWDIPMASYINPANTAIGEELNEMAEGLMRKGRDRSASEDNIRELVEFIGWYVDNKKGPIASPVNVEDLYLLLCEYTGVGGDKGGPFRREASIRKDRAGKKTAGAADMYLRTLADIFGRQYFYNERGGELKGDKMIKINLIMVNFIEFYIGGDEGRYSEPQKIDALYREFRNMVRNPRFNMEAFRRLLDSVFPPGYISGKQEVVFCDSEVAENWWTGDMRLGLSAKGGGKEKGGEGELSDVIRIKAAGVQRLRPILEKYKNNIPKKSRGRYDLIQELLGIDPHMSDETVGKKAIELAPYMRALERDGRAIAEAIIRDVRKAFGRPETPSETELKFPLTQI